MPVHPLGTPVSDGRPAAAGTDRHVLARDARSAEISEGESFLRYVREFLLGNGAAE